MNEIVKSEHEQSYQGKPVLSLAPIKLSEEYKKTWNTSNSDYVHLLINGIKVNDNLYRVGGLCKPDLTKDRIFLLLKYTEAKWDLEFLRSCYKDYNEKQLSQRINHLQISWCIINEFGQEVRVFEGNLTYPYVIKDSIIYSYDHHYFNALTGEDYGECASTVITKEHIILSTSYSDDKPAIVINKQTGVYYDIK